MDAQFNPANCPIDVLNSANTIRNILVTLDQFDCVDIHFEKDPVPNLEGECVGEWEVTIYEGRKTFKQKWHDLSYNWSLRWLNDVCSQNPSARCNENPADPNWEPPHVAIGRALWGELHSKASTDFEPYALRDWFDAWLNRVPNYGSGCRCRDNAIQILNSMPPDFSREGFKAWASRFHSEVSRRLGKKPWVPESTPAGAPPS